MTHFQFRSPCRLISLLALAFILVGAAGSVGGTGSLVFSDEPFGDMPINQWVKISPLVSTPPSPQLGYEGDCVWDNIRSRLIRYGGHNQGGGGEQNSELWFFDPKSKRWSLTHPNIQPPGVCCAQQNVFDSSRGNYIRFPAFSHTHGWQWMREVYLNNTSVWTFPARPGTVAKHAPAAHALSTIASMRVLGHRTSSPRFVWRRRQR